MADNPVPPNPNAVPPYTASVRGTTYKGKSHTVLGVSLAAIAAVVVVSYIAMRDDPAVMDTQPTPPASTMPSTPSPGMTPTPSTPDSPPLPNTAPTSPTTPEAPVTPRTEGSGNPL